MATARAQCAAAFAYDYCMQYTVRNIPETLDDELRRRARREGKSLNEVALEAMARGVGHCGDPVRYRDLSDVAGTWKDDPEFDSAIDELDRVDPELWER